MIQPFRQKEDNFQSIWDNAKPYESIPGPSFLQLVLGLLPGGKYVHQCELFSHAVFHSQESITNSTCWICSASFVMNMDKLRKCRECLAIKRSSWSWIQLISSWPFATKVFGRCAVASARLIITENRFGPIFSKTWAVCCLNRVKLGPKCDPSSARFYWSRLTCMRTFRASMILPSSFVIASNCCETITMRCRPTSCMSWINGRWKQ